METEITMMWQAPCVGGNCEAVYKAPEGFVIQGKRLGPVTTTHLSRCAGDETAVYVTADALRAALQLLGD